MKLLKSIAAVGLLSAAGIAHAHDAETSAIIEAIGHAPIAVMGDHRHKAGELMFSYRFMQMNMARLQYGENEISAEKAAGFGLHMVPEKMTMNMHMLGAMYGLSNRVTLMLGMKYLNNTMTMQTFDTGIMHHTMNAEMMDDGHNHEGDMSSDMPMAIGSNSVSSSGFGDIKLAALIALAEGRNQKLHVNLALSFPTGSITEKDQVLMPTGMKMSRRLAYMMQLGSGTYDVTGGFTFVNRMGDVSLGGQYLATIRLGRNDEGYSLGDIHQATTWFAYQFEPWISSSIRLGFRNVATVDGRDNEIMLDPENTGGQRFDLGLGLNLAGFEQHRLAFEYILPVSEDVNGIRLATEDMFTLGYQLSF